LQLQPVFKIKILNKNAAAVESWLALVHTTIPENSSNLNHVLKFVHVRNAQAAVALLVFIMGNIVGYSHVFRLIATSGKTRDGRMARWIVDSHVDLETWIDISHP
jgi:hypothetical protein